MKKNPPPRDANARMPAKIMAFPHPSFRIEAISCTKKPGAAQ
jgi:hypothetical protein